MSIYVAIEVLKWLQVKSIYSDYDLLKDPQDDNALASFYQSKVEPEKLEQMRARNMVKIANTEVIENLG